MAQIGDQTLELRPLVRLAGEGTIDVVFYDDDVLLRCVGVNCLVLRLDGGFILAIGRIATVCDSGRQGDSPPQTRQR